MIKCSYGKYGFVICECPLLLFLRILFEICELKVRMEFSFDYSQDSVVAFNDDKSSGHSFDGHQQTRCVQWQFLGHDTSHLEDLHVWSSWSKDNRLLFHQVMSRPDVDGCPRHRHYFYPEYTGVKSIFIPFNLVVPTHPQLICINNH